MCCHKSDISLMNSFWQSNTDSQRFMFNYLSLEIVMIHAKEESVPIQSVIFTTL